MVAKAAQAATAAAVTEEATASSPNHVDPDGRPDHGAAAARTEELYRDHGRLVALQCQHVAAQEDVTVQMAFERAQDRVLATRKLCGDGIVELERLAHAVAYESASRTRAEARFPSARPPDLDMTTFITAPSSRRLVAPVSAIAEATIAASSESPSSAGR